MRGDFDEQPDLFIIYYKSKQTASHLQVEELTTSRLRGLFLHQLVKTIPQTSKKDVTKIFSIIPTVYGGACVCGVVHYDKNISIVDF